MNMRTNRKPGPRFIGLLVFVLTALAGVALLVGGAMRIMECRRLQRGRTAEATITQATPTTWTSGKNKTRNYGFDLRFTYTVDGRTVVGTRRAVSSFSTRSETHRDSVMARYAPGTVHTVHFEPDKPSRGVLDPSISPSMGMAPIGGSAFVCFGIFVASLVIRHSYPDPALPVNSRREGHEVVIDARFGPIGSLMLLVVVPTVGIIAAGVWGLSVTGQPTDSMLTLAAAAPIAGTLVLSVVGRRLFASPRGAIRVNAERCTVTIHPWLGPAPGPIPFERIVDVRLIFRPSKSVRKPDSKQAHFRLEITSLDDGGAPVRTVLSNHSYSREDAFELAGWLREAVCLPGSPTVG